MKIWIITSWSETLSLFKFLSKYTHDYVVYYDFLHWPYGDKTFEQSLAYVEQWIDFLMKQGVETVIVPPIYELSLLEKKTKVPLLPLFKNYLFDYCFTYSLVGKLGLFWDFADMQVAQTLFKDIAKTYSLVANQQSIKKFHFPFVYRAKETPLWKYYLTSLSYSNILVNKIIKFDLRYFKDAMVDTIVPLNYWYFHYQTTITKFLNFKKIRFHGLQNLEKTFDSLNLKQSTIYSVKIAYTWNNDFLLREKRLIWLLQRGKSTDIVREKIYTAPLWKS